jgi:RimJ/RimL family protein N-acetyltransferase
MNVRLVHRPFRDDDLPVVEAWFDDRETHRWLGDRKWPRQLLDLAREPGRFAILFMLRDRPVALLDLERDSEETATFAVVVSPSHRRQGLASTVIASVLELPQANGVREFMAEIEHSNTAANRLICSLQFEAISGADQGFERYVLRRT